MFPFPMKTIQGNRIYRSVVNLQVNDKWVLTIKLKHSLKELRIENYGKEKLRN